MSGVEIVNFLKKILGKFEKVTGIKVFSGKNEVICLNSSSCITIYNPETRIEWNENDLPVKITLLGKDSNGNVRVFEKELVWDINPLTGNPILKEVKPWVEVT